jgi:hypothetical protein
MESQLKYIELKTGHAHNGPAWIGKVEFSKSRKTMYFNGHALKGNGHGVCYDVETRDIYWISGIKKNGQDRHRFGNGRIMIDRLVVDEYLKSLNVAFLDPKKYELVDIVVTDKKKFVDIENSKIDTPDDFNKYQDIIGSSIPELRILVDELKEKERETNSNNGLKYYTVKRLEAEKYLDEIQKQAR